MLDLEGCVVNWNAGAERIKGYRSEEIIGRHFSRFYPEEDMNEESRNASSSWRPSRASSKTKDGGIRKDGSRFWPTL